MSTIRSGCSSSFWPRKTSTRSDGRDACSPSIIDGWKNRGLTPDKVPAGEAATFANGRGIELYKAYQARLKTLNAADFGDLLIETLRLFRDHPEVLRQYHERFRFVLVDEYQDTNVAQYLWLRLIGQGSKNICCVGDDDQSIYGWRGAEVDNILRFEKDFPGAKVIRLERNYRSTAHILGAASHLIAHNEGRLGKTLRTEDEPGEKVGVTGAWDSEEEARAIGEEIEELQRDGHSLDEIAILVRASFQMREFEDRFVTLGLPYRVIGGPRFYERAEIRDALAYLRLVNQPADDLAFERIINTPRRGLRRCHAASAAASMRARRTCRCCEAARALAETEELKAKPRGALRDVVAMFDRWRAQKDTLPHTELAEIILDESGYTEMWQKDRSADAAGRLENLKELVRSMEEFENLQGFLEHISLVMDTEKGEGAGSRLDHDAALRQGARIRHRVPARLGGRRAAAPALARRSGPRRPRGGAPPRARRHHPRAAPRQDLFHLQPAHPRIMVVEHPVALSRRVARGACRGDRSEGRLRQFRPELRRLALRHDGELRLELHDARLAARAGAQGAQQRRLRGRRRRLRLRMRRIAEIAAARRAAPESSAEAPHAAHHRGRTGREIDRHRVAVRLGDRVFHQKFGNGNVTHVDGNKLTIAFDRAGEKRVVDSFVERV